jgi:phospholipase C
VEQVFGLPPLTERDRHAVSVAFLASLTAPRDTPATLPKPARTPVPQQGKPFAAGPWPHADEPADQGNLPGFLGAALQADLQLSDPAERDEIIARVAAITTRGEARNYLSEVGEKLAAMDSARAAEAAAGAISSASRQQAYHR